MLDINSQTDLILYTEGQYAVKEHPQRWSRRGLVDERDSLFPIDESPVGVQQQALQQLIECPGLMLPTQSTCKGTSVHSESKS